VVSGPFIPPLPALHATHGGIWLATAEGTRALGRGEAIALASETPTILLNAPMVAARLGLSELSGPDLLELYAFVHPARFAVPTPAGLARALGIQPPEDDAGAAAFLRVAAATLFATLGDPASGGCAGPGPVWSRR
jgi:ATP-dependent DNA helicase DinG